MFNKRTVQLVDKLEIELDNSNNRLSIEQLADLGAFKHPKKFIRAVNLKNKDDEFILQRGYGSYKTVLDNYQDVHYSDKNEILACELASLAYYGKKEKVKPSRVIEDMVFALL